MTSGPIDRSRTLKPDLRRLSENAGLHDSALGRRPRDSPGPAGGGSSRLRGLLIRIADGDVRALDGLYRDAGTFVYSIALSIVGEPADANEVVADSFLQIWESAADFNPERASARTWISVIVRTRALDFVRAGRRRAEALERSAARDGSGIALPVSSPAATPDVAAEKNDVRRRVRQLLNTLPEAQRRVIELAYLRGLSHTEIARELDMPLGTIKTRIRGGMTRLRRSMRHDRPTTWV